MRIVRGLWKVLVGIKDALVLLFLLIFFGAIYAALSMSPNPSGQPRKGALLVNLDGSLVEQKQDFDPVALLAGSNRAAGEYSQRELVRALRAAASDANVKVVVLDLDRFSGGGQATLSEAAAAIDQVRAGGKPVLAFATGYLDDSYLLASHASEIWLDPLGMVMIAGPGGQHLYYKGLLDKIGVTAKIYRVGTYKSAVEPFSRTNQSPEAKQAAQALADSLWQSWLADVKRARPKAQLAEYASDPEKAAAGANGQLAQAALGVGLVDRLGNRSEFEQRVASIAGEGDKASPYKAIDFVDYANAHPEAQTGKGIGVLTIAGDIVDGEAGGGTAGGDTIASLLGEELSRDRISALVLRIDSPGGSVMAAERIRNAIMQAKAKGLPVVASMGSVAASGGYWVATTADRIYAEPSTITGSIGVFGIIPTFAGTLEKLGLSADGVTTTPLSGEPNVLTGPSPTFDRMMQLGIEDIYRRFIGLVGQARKLSPQQVDAIGQGRVWAGTAARANRLIDGYGSLDTAIAEAARLAKLDPAKAHPVFIQHEPNPFEKFLQQAARSRDRHQEDARDALSKAALRPEQLLAQALADSRRLTSDAAIQVRCLECAAVSSPGPQPMKGETVWTLVTHRAFSWLF